MKKTITVCDEHIDKIIPPDIDRALSFLCEASAMCGRSVCGNGTRPRLVFKTIAQRDNFVLAAKQLGHTSHLGSWLAKTNPRLAIWKGGQAVSPVASIDFL